MDANNLKITRYLKPRSRADELSQWIFIFIAHQNAENKTLEIPRLHFVKHSM